MKKLDIQVGDRVTYIETRMIIDENRDRMGDISPVFTLKTKEVKNKVVEIVTKDNEDYKDVLKIERIGQNGWYTVYEKEKEILDDKEKEYLRNVIKPFKNRVQNIIKGTVIQANPFEFKVKQTEHIVIQIVNDENIYLPTFKKNTMYKNMKTNKQYTLKELGLE